MEATHFKQTSMYPKITYLFGAGASANIHDLANKPNDNRVYANALLNFVQNTLRFEALDDYFFYEDLALQCLNFGTPDTYAHFLYQMKNLDDNSKRYYSLKKLISYFFVRNTNSQYEIGKVENRILPFLSKLLRNGKIAENVNFLSWNYDRQFELVIDKYINRYHNINDDLIIWPNIDSKLPQFIHLNGVSGYYHTQKGAKLYDPVNHFSYLLDKNEEPTINFAWEEFDKIRDGGVFIESRLSLAEKIIKGTEILVVIGYSFPDFNHNIDKYLLNIMAPSLQKIYFQDKFNDGSFLVKRFKLNDLANSDFKLEVIKDEIEFVWEKNVNNYIIPTEYFG